MVRTNRRTVREEFRRQVAIAGDEVVRRVQGEGLGVAVDPEANPGRHGGSVGGTFGILAPRLEPMEGCFAILEVALEERARRWGRRCVDQWSALLAVFRLQEHREQALALVRLRGQAAVEVRGRLAACNGPLRDPLFLVDVMHVHEHGRVADVPVCLLVLLHQDFQDARVPPDCRIGALGHQVDDLRFGDLTVAIHAPISLLKDHQRPGQVEVNQTVALVMQVDALGGDIEQIRSRTGRWAFPKSSTMRCCSTSLMPPWSVST